MNHTCVDLAEGLAANPGSEKAVTCLWGRISAFNMGLTTVTITQTWFSSILVEIILWFNKEWISKCSPYTRVTVRLNFVWNTSEELLSSISTERENPDAFLGSGTLYLRVAWKENIMKTTPQQELKDPTSVLHHQCAFRHCHQGTRIN